MNLFFRLIAVLIAALAGNRRGFLDEARLGFRVWPTDLDFNLHMTNARYLSLMDLGRVDLMVRVGLGPHIVRNRWQPVIGAANVRFRRSLRPFQPFTLVSRVLCWDEKYLFIEHRIEAGGTVAALAVVQGAFVAAGAVVPPAEIMRAIGGDPQSPPMPDFVAAWRGQPLPSAA